MFTAYTNWLTRQLEEGDPDLIGKTKPPSMTDDQWKQFQTSKVKRSSTQQGESSSSGSQDPEAKMNALFNHLEKWETNFSRHLQILLDALNHYAATETVVLLSLCARLSTANQGTEYAGMRNEDDSTL